MQEGIVLGGIPWMVFRGLILIRNKKYKRISVKRELIFNLFVIYCIAVTSVTLFPLALDMGGLPRHKPAINIVPFVEIVKDFQHLPFSFAFKLKLLLRNLVGNLLLLLPLGLFLPLLWAKFGTLRTTVLFGASISFLIEASQFILVYLGLTIGRATDIDDLILNTLGVVVGYTVLDKILVRFKWLLLLREDKEPNSGSSFFLGLTYLGTNKFSDTRFCLNVL